MCTHAPQMIIGQVAQRNGPLVIALTYEWMLAFDSRRIFYHLCAANP